MQQTAGQLDPKGPPRKAPRAKTAYPACDCVHFVDLPAKANHCGRDGKLCRM